jgi:hypothetical protein
MLNDSGLEDKIRNEVWNESTMMAKYLSILSTVISGISCPCKTLSEIRQG